MRSAAAGRLQSASVYDELALSGRRSRYPAAGFGGHERRVSGGPLRAQECRESVLGRCVVVVEREHFVRVGLGRPCRAPPRGSGSAPGRGADPGRDAWRQLWSVAVRARHAAAAARFERLDELPGGRSRIPGILAVQLARGHSCAEPAAAPEPDPCRRRPCRDGCRRVHEPCGCAGDPGCAGPEQESADAVPRLIRRPSSPLYIIARGSSPHSMSHICPSYSSIHPSLEIDLHCAVAAAAT